MSPEDRKQEVEQMMDEAFAAGAGSPEEKQLQAFLQENPEYKELWGEYQTLRKGMTLLEGQQGPSELTKTRIHRASRKRFEEVHPSRGWRWLLSQPIVAAATVLVVVGIGIYSQYLMKEPKTTDEKVIPSEIKKDREQAPPRSGAGRPVMEEMEIQLDAAPVGGAPPPRAIKRERAAPPPSGAGRAVAPTKVMAPTLKFKQAAPRPAPMDRDEVKKITPAAAPAPPSEAPPQSGTGFLKAKKTRAQSSYEGLLAQAKERIAAQDCAGALVLLKEAQKVNDTEEVRKLITQCEKGGK